MAVCSGQTYVRKVEGLAWQEGGCGESVWEQRLSPSM